jgi:hypothetical protein
MSGTREAALTCARVRRCRSSDAENATGHTISASGKNNIATGADGLGGKRAM